MVKSDGGDASGLMPASSLHGLQMCWGDNLSHAYKTLQIPSTARTV